MTYYRSPEERAFPPAPRDANDDGRNELDRRDFLKAAGFTLAVAASACSRSPVTEAIPFAVAQEEIVPGRAYWMASTCHGCPARCGVLVKCRDGRPIKIEGNPEHPVSKGGLCATGQAMVLGPYDSLRLAGPMLRGASSDWAVVDRAIGEKLTDVSRVRVLSTTLASPTADRVISEFLARFHDGKHVIYDVPSASAILDAHEKTQGVRLLPRYRFDAARVIVSLDADFLGTWISPVEFTKAWSARRGSGETRSWHAQLESRLSLTGSKADQRVRVHPNEITAVLSWFAGLTPEPAIKPLVLARMRTRLEEARGHSLVVSGSNRLEDQMLVNAINARLGNYGSTLDLDAPSHQRSGSDRDLAGLLAELREGSVDALFVVDTNPVYDLPNGDELATLLGRVPLVVTFASHVDETSKVAHAVCPGPHPLEAWHDSEPVAGVYSVTQPAIPKLKNTRAVIESFAAWSGKPARAYDLIRETARTAEWDRTLNDGFLLGARDQGLGARDQGLGARDQGLETTRSSPSPYAPSPSQLGSTEALTPILHPSIAMLDGRHAHNVWLHELPDPISKVTWDNYAALSPERAAKLGVRDGDVVRIAAGKDSLDLPAFVQPGQHDGVVAIAIGYGRIGTERFAKVGPQWLLRRTHLTPGEPVGSRAIQFAAHEAVSVTKTGARHELATTQLHSTIDAGRPSPVRETGGESHHESEHGHDLWPKKAKGEIQWALAIDLTRCTGCSACLVGCQAENNVPVVGKDEVLREREMHWIRIDRYYSGEGDDLAVAHQPMMCAHCGNAPCETVCPVLATAHSSDGLNQQIYNRCVGTRYCANNCPYKVRRFNWFDYPHDDRFASLVLNPDVTVRSRGVMEKCSMCVQRIEEARIVAKQKGEPIRDGAARMACEQSCPADAIVFGNANDPKSRIASLRHDPRHYTLLEELNIRPAVGYLELERNA